MSRPSSDDTTHTPQAERITDHAERMEQNIAAALRAISGETTLQPQYGMGTSSFRPSAHLMTKQSDGSRSVKLPSPKTTHYDDDSLRGAADSAAIYIDQHDKTTHDKHAPFDPQARMAYDILEQVRCEAAGTRHLKGVRQNILHAMEEQSARNGYGHRDTPTTPTKEDALFALTRQTLFDLSALPDHTKSAAQYWEKWFTKKLGADGFDELLEHIHDQDRYAELAHTLCKRLMVEGHDSSEDEEDDQQKQTSGDQDESNDQNQESEQNSEAQLEQQSETSEERIEQSDLAQEQETASPEHKPQDGQEDGNPLERSAQGQSDFSAPSYRVFTDQFDQTASALDLVSREELEHLRHKLDKQLDPLKAFVAKLANRLQRFLMAQQQRHWQFDVEDGILDPARLARVITTPGAPLSYKIEKDTDFKDTVVSLLIDNSGSMRGRPITIAALSTDILARTLERCGIKVEILGFTTSTWKGGLSREEWGKQGRPSEPGRLNDLLHIIYKSADAPWIRTRKNLGLMLKDGLLKENIDGEALRWAYKRLISRPENRKILMVISDGAPVDDSTLSANTSGFLEEDLRQTIRSIEAQKAAELLAIGIGHDVTQYYRKAVTIRQVEELGPTMIDQLVSLFDFS